jgi:hypothetical protein
MDVLLRKNSSEIVVWIVVLIQRGPDPACGSKQMIQLRPLSHISRLPTGKTTNTNRSTKTKIAQQKQMAL